MERKSRLFFTQKKFGPIFSKMSRCSYMRAAFVLSSARTFAIERIPKPRLDSAKDVLIKTAVAGINRPDVLQRNGIYPPPPGHSPIPGLEVSGVVEEVGEEVTRFKIGDKVCALTNGGGYAEYCKVPEGQVLPIPRGLDLVHAACIPETFFTVYHVFQQQCNIFGENAFHMDNPSILIHGGSSGIGTTAIQLAREWGAQVITTVGSAEKCQAVEKLGAVGINYKEKNFKEEVMLHTDGKGVNLILDMVGGPYLNDNLSILQLQGRLAVIGSLGAPIAEEADLRLLMRKRLTVGGSTIRAQSDQFKQKLAADLQTNVWPLFESNRIQVVLFSSDFSLESIDAAHKLMEGSSHIGKICAIINPTLVDN